MPVPTVTLSVSAGAPPASGAPPVAAREPTALLRPLAELSSAERAAWARLCERSEPPNPFWHPDLVEAAAGVLFDRERAALLVAAEGREWVGCLPIELVLRRPRCVVRALVHPYCFNATPLMAGARPATVARALASALAELRPAAIWLPDLVDCRASRALLSALLGTGDYRVAFERRWERSLLSRAVASSRPADRLARKLRADLRRRVRRLEEHARGPVGAVVRSPDGATLQTILALEASGWKGSAGSAIACDPRHVAFFTTVLRRFAARDALFLVTLEAAGRPVAFASALAAGDQLFGFKRGYDGELARFAPGRLLDLEFERLFLETRREQLVDSCCSADNDAMAPLWPGRRSMRALLLARRGLAGGATRLVFSAVRWARRVADGRGQRRTRPRPR